MTSPRIPISTYRLQLHSGFGFEDARSIISYLHKLGISDLYASPIFKARRGSTHGYDVKDPTQLNPELGSQQIFEGLVQEIKARHMGLLLDIVPNHMAASTQNPWWSDILENGTASPYASFYDIDWTPVSGLLKDKVLLPILGSPYAQVLENQELLLGRDDEGIHLNYYETPLPINTRGCSLIATHRLNILEARMTATDFQHLRETVNSIESLTTDASYDAIKALRSELFHIIESSPVVRSHVDDNIAIFNGRKGETGSFVLLDELLATQFYRLVFWKQASEEINYRRFFDISDLAGLRVEDSAVFEAVHSLVLRLVREGAVTGLRLDHVDGLYDPLEYLMRLQTHLASETGTGSDGDKFYVVAEKILAGDETLRDDWPISGTSGYDFLNAVNALFVDGQNIENLRASYQRFVGSEEAFHEIVYQKKKQVIADLFPSELRALTQRLSSLAWQDRYGCDISRSQLTSALIEVTACLPVYRTYIRSNQVATSDRKLLEIAIKEATERCPELENRTLEFIRHVLTVEMSDETAKGGKGPVLDFVMRWQQFTGPVMAKGVEDTALYNYNFLTSLNDVGGEPDRKGFGIEAFHEFSLARQSQWPHTMSATSTHDTKRSEDVRARINVLSEMPEEWNRHVLQWRDWNLDKKSIVNRTLLPDANTEWFTYQTMIGAWPLFDGEVTDFRERLKAYLVKAAREAKTLTNWHSPNDDAESALTAFVDSILEESSKNLFMENFQSFQKQVAFYGAINSLSQVLLKAASPGIPDFYQGTELWDFSLVDPDNRRPIDFNPRKKLLYSLMETEESDLTSHISALLDTWYDGRIKLYLTHKVLSARNRYRDVFSCGDYLPLQTQGTRERHVSAFARRHGESWVISVTPRITTGISEAGIFPLGIKVWGDDMLILPDEAPKEYINLLTSERIEPTSAGNSIRLADIFYQFPVALLASRFE